MFTFIVLLSQLVSVLHLVCSAIPQSQSQLLGAKGSELFEVAEATSAGKLAQPQQNLFDWVKNDNRRFLHVVYRVGDLDKTIKYAVLYFI